MYRQLVIWVEGPGDLRFFEKLIKPRFEKKFDFVSVVPYKGDEYKGKMRKKKIISHITCIEKLNGKKGTPFWDYLFIADINDTPCKTLKKQQIKSIIKNIDVNKIVVVIKEIEGWYLAGLNRKSSKELLIRCYRNTDRITKDQFDSIIHNKFDSEIDFMVEILQRFSIKESMKKNKSLRYFLKKHDC